MTPTSEKDPALLEQARALVKAIKPGPLYEELDKRAPVKPGYTLRYNDLRHEFAVEVAYETLVRTGQTAPAARQRDLDIVVRALAAGRRTALAHRNMQRGADAYTVAQADLLAVQNGLEALGRLAGQLPPADPAELAAHIDAHTKGTGIVRTDPDGTATRIDPADVYPPSTPAPDPAPAAPAPEVKW